MLSEAEAIFTVMYGGVTGGFGLRRSLYLKQAGLWLRTETALVILTVFLLCRIFSVNVSL